MKSQGANPTHTSGAERQTLQSPPESPPRLGCQRTRRGHTVTGRRRRRRRRRRCLFHPSRKGGVGPPLQTLREVDKEKGCWNCSIRSSGPVWGKEVCSIRSSGPVWGKEVVSTSGSCYFWETGCEETKSTVGVGVHHPWADFHVRRVQARLTQPLFCGGKSRRSLCSGAAK